MANGKITLGKQSGGTLGLVFPDGISNTDVVLPESGNIASIDTAVTDNALARYDGTTGKLQNSGVIVDDSGNIGIGTTSSPIGAGKGIELGFSGGIYGDGINYNWNTQVTQNAYPITGGQHRYRHTQPAGAYIIDGSAHIWRTAPLGTANSPITWTNAMTLDASGNLLLKSGTGALGYGAGAGGVVTQLTSKSTSVTLNKPCGRIIMNNSALAIGASAYFVVNNSLFGSYDIVKLTGKSWSSRYRIEDTNNSTGQFCIMVTNISDYSQSDPIEIDFTIIKGATA